jgi:D-arabinitol dehydrogenase (NADP+)
MRAVVYDAPRQFSVRTVATPEPGPGEVRLRMVATGVCGTDLHIHDGDFFARFPLTPGHEPVGIVDQLGPGVEGLTLGQQVAANGNSGCGHCAFCQRGRSLLCRDLRALGVTGPGGFAEYMLVPAGQCFSVTDLPLDAAVMVEPTACAMHGVETLALRPGVEVLLFGAGPTGLVLAQLLARSGAARVVVAAPTAFKLELARRFGIDETILVDRADPAGSVQRLRMLASEGFDVVVDATGSAAVSAQCIGLARDGGTVLIYGVTRPDERIPISPYEIYRRELTIKGSFAQVSSFPLAIAALRTGRVQTDGIITHRFPLDRFGEALEAVRSDPTCLKAAVVL